MATPSTLKRNCSTQKPPKVASNRSRVPAPRPLPPNVSQSYLGPAEDLLRIRFRGRIIHIRKQEQVLGAVAALSVLKIKHTHGFDPTHAIGFDMEWRPEDPTKDEINKVALIQICTSTTCLLFHMLELGHMPDLLRSMLEDACVQKVCHGFETSDCIRLRRDFGIVPRNFVDTAQFARCLGNRRCGLQTLVNQHFFPLYLDKSLATSDWGAVWLTPDQTLYAATDAWVTRELFLKLIACQSSLSVPHGLPWSSLAPRPPPLSHSISSSPGSHTPSLNDSEG
eukprot:c4989_g1_i1.p1 GENE.c4989_g1_i1~~c4989_g1_i1.p1  ORF type:complete len:328 (-),score=32.63 c4989_g1_i1:360-1202(-)